MISEAIVIIYYNILDYLKNEVKLYFNSTDNSYKRLAIKNNIDNEEPKFELIISEKSKYFKNNYEYLFNNNTLLRSTKYLKHTLGLSIIPEESKEYSTIDIDYYDKSKYSQNLLKEDKVNYEDFIFYENLKFNHTKKKNYRTCRFCLLIKVKLQIIKIAR